MEFHLELLSAAHLTPARARCPPCRNSKWVGFGGSWGQRLRAVQSADSRGVRGVQRCKFEQMHCHRFIFMFMCIFRCMFVCMVMCICASLLEAGTITLAIPPGPLFITNQSGVCVVALDSLQKQRSDYATRIDMLSATRLTKNEKREPAAKFTAVLTLT